MKNCDKWIIYSFLTILIGCSNPIKHVLIYNPTANDYTLDFNNGKPPIEVQGYTPQTITLQYGKINISVNGGVNETFYLDKNDEYVINPSKSLLFVVDIPYSSHQNNETMRKIKTYLDTTTDIDGEKYIGRVKRYDNLVFKKDFNYTFENVPQSIGMNLNKDQIAFGRVLMPLEQLISNQLDFSMIKMGQ